MVANLGFRSLLRGCPLSSIRIISIFLLRLSGYYLIRINDVTLEAARSPAEFEGPQWPENQKLQDPPALASAGGDQRPFETGKTVKQPGTLEWPLKWLNEAISEGWRLRLQVRMSAMLTSRLWRNDYELRMIRTGSVPDQHRPATHASMGRLTFGLSPSALWLAYADWAIHLSGSPGKHQSSPKSLRGRRFGF